MLKKYDGTNWNTVSYGKYFLGTEQFTNFPLVIRSLDQSVQEYTIKGNTSASGTPSPQNPVTISGVGDKTANLLNYTLFQPYSTFSTVTVIDNGVNISGSFMATLDIALIENTTYTMSWTQEVISGTADTAWRIKYTDNTYSAYVSNGGNMTVSKAVSQVLLYVTKSENTASVNFTTIMLNTGSTALPYEPYNKYKISILKDSQPLTPIYVSQQLINLEAVEIVDTIASSGTATYNTYKLVLTGNETWYDDALPKGNTYSYRMVAPYIYDVGNTVGYDAICTHFDVGSYYAASVVGVQHSSRNLYFRNTQTTLANWQQWLADQYAAGTPVTVYYRVATPTTESVTAPSITTTGGTATIDVDTTVKPSEVSLTYNGKHLNKSKKFSVGNNLIPYPYYQGDGTVAGVTWTTYSDGRIVGTGKTKDEVQFKLADSLILSSGTYTISITGTHTGMSLLVRNKDNYTQVARIQSNDTSPVTFTISEEGRYEIYYNVLSYNVNVDIDCYIMLNLGSSALPYEPYGSWT